MKLLRRFAGQHVNGVIYVSDALDLLRQTESERVALILLDPPFNLGKRYGASERSDRKSNIEYENWMRNILDECVRVLEPGGSLFLYHLPGWGIRLGAYLDGRLKFRHWIAVSMKNGFVRGRRLYPAHYALLYFTKDEPKYFRRPKIRPSRCRHCGDFVKDYGGYVDIIKAKGINVSDFWEDISPVRHSKKKYRAANELPSKLTERVVTIAGRKGKVYLDPFAGAGSGVIAAAKRGMRIIAADSLEKNVAIIKLRLAELQSESARSRSIRNGRQS